MGISVSSFSAPFAKQRVMRLLRFLDATDKKDKNSSNLVELAGEYQHIHLLWLMFVWPRLDFESGLKKTSSKIAEKLDKESLRDVEPYNEKNEGHDKRGRGRDQRTGRKLSSFSRNSDGHTVDSSMSQFDGGVADANDLKYGFQWPSLTWTMERSPAHLKLCSISSE
ncbi:hypothetical protein NE237_028649 [Protea cynaroides]|uniref:Uncharacterized protein n=1 Tax=Protea cynaroides TaxID=273540 RepID=A0A9Q0GPR2_9MAGN|nr:hypothetical protein NE237_028649 [Protea cynaroides]